MHTFTLPLSQHQAAFLQNYLPLCHSLHPAPPDSKRPRATKKIDDSFTSDFVLLPHKRSNPFKNTTPTKHNSTPTKHNSTRPQLPTQTNNHPSPLTHQMINPSKQNQQIKKNEQSELDIWMNKLLRALKNDKSSKPFRNSLESNTPQTTQHQSQQSYSLQQPIDLRIIERNMKSGVYKNHQQLDSDIRRIISNSYQLNTPQHSSTLVFQEFYSELVNQLPPPIQPKTTEYTHSHQTPKKHNNPDTPSKPDHKPHKKQPRTDGKMVQSNPSQQGGQGESGQVRSGLKQLKFREREKMFNKINKLSQQSLCNFIKLCGVNTTSEWSQMEIDLAYLSDEAFRKIEAFLSQQ